MIHDKFLISGDELSDHYYAIVEPDINTLKKYVMVIN
jgi:hypothetical protein